MQGRASPKHRGKYQAHPVNNWKGEFSFAAKHGFSSIEFIADFEEFHSNPIFKDGGSNLILEQSLLTGVNVDSICADCFMELPFHSSNTMVVDLAHMFLSRLIDFGGKLTPLILVLPCVDQSRFQNSIEIKQFVQEIRSRVQELKDANIWLSLETDLNAKDFGNLLDLLPDSVGVNYDVGNSASLGFDMDEEFSVYGSRVNDVHLKDRGLNTGSVKFGYGNANFQQLVQKLIEHKYSGPVIMQSYRSDDDGDLLLEQRLYFQNILEQLIN
jgi:L-ribulose-5-phosphate 3-epimerase